jgi:hypothetical protein
MSLVRRILMLMSMLVLMGIPTLTATAQESEEGGSGLQISPIRNRLTILPGETKTITISVKNVTQGNLVAKVSLNDFESDGVSGEPKILIDTKERTANSLEKYLTGFNEIALKSGETKEVKLTLSVPDSIPAGAYYGAIRFTAVPEGTNEADRRVTLNASVASLALVEVAGDITEQIQLLSVRAERGNTKGSFFFSAPNTVAIEVKNTGNGFSQPFGRVSITNMSNKEVHSYELNNKDPRGNILPGSTRLFKDELKNITSPGRYKISANISHGTGGQVISQSGTFWYVPVWLVVVVVGLVVALILGAYILYRARMNRQMRRHRR